MEAQWNEGPGLVIYCSAQHGFHFQGNLMTTQWTAVAPAISPHSRKQEGKGEKKEPAQSFIIFFLNGHVPS